MSSKRGNPVQQGSYRKALSQSVVHPVANDVNTSGGNPAKMRVPAAKGSKVFGSIGNPVGKRKHNMTGDSGNKS